MTNVLANAILIAKETTYGTAVTPSRGYEGKSDTFIRAQEVLTSTGFRAGIQAERSARRSQVNMGGEGTLEIEILKNGFGLLLQGLLGSISGPTQQGATTAYKSTAQTTSADPDDSYTIQVRRPDMGGTTRIFDHLGSVITGWNISGEVGGLAMASINFDFRDVDSAGTAGSPTYPAGAPFDWTECVVSVNGANTDVMSFSIDADLGLKTDRRFLRGDALKKQPCRATLPQFSGQLEMEFEDLTEYNLYTAGTIVPIIITFTGDTIASPYSEELKITMEACQFNAPASPQMNLTDTPVQSLPFSILWDETNPTVKIEYTSTDTTL